MTDDESHNGQADDVHRRLDVASIAVIALTLFVTLKAYGAAEFSLTTAAALLTDAPLSVLLATLVSYAYYVLPVLSLALFSWAVMAPSRPTMDRLLLRLAAGAGGVVTAALSPPQYLIPILVGLVLILLVRRVIGRPPSPIPLLACYLGLLAVAIFIATITRMWTPVEVVTARTGVNTSRYISHVVSQDSQWTTLLTTNDRRLVRVLSSDVVHRQICHHPTQPRGGRPLIYWILGKEYSSPNAACENICQDPERSVPPPPGATRVQATPCES